MKSWSLGLSAAKMPWEDGEAERMKATQAGVRSYPVCLKTILDVLEEIPKANRKVIGEAKELQRLDMTST